MFCTGFATFLSSPRVKRRRLEHGTIPAEFATHCFDVTAPCFFFDLATVVKPAYFLFLKRVPVVVSKSGMVYSVSALLATRLFLSLRHQRFRQQPRWLSLRNRQTSSSARKARRAGV